MGFASYKCQLWGGMAAPVVGRMGSKKHAKLRNEPDWKSMVFIWNSLIVKALGCESGKFQSGSFGTECR